MILDWHDNNQTIGDIEQPAAAKRQRKDAGGIPGELIQRLATEYAWKQPEYFYVKA